MAFQGSYGDAGFADMLTGATFDQELKVALGTIPMDPSWKLRCDTEGGNNNGQADIGEQVPIDPGIRNTWGASLTAGPGQADARRPRGLELPDGHPSLRGSLGSAVGR